jgi:hypothetical protein
MLLSQKRLRQLLGILWLLDGLLQLQPQMFTMNMVNGIMVPTLQAQPVPIAASLQWIIQITTHHLVLVNWGIALIQLAIGLCLISGRWVKGALVVSLVWALIVWYAGEGLGVLLTGQASALTGAPGAVLLYALVALALYPRQAPHTSWVENGSQVQVGESGLLSRKQLRWAFAGFWFLAALLQVQPYWWQQGQISQAIAGLVGQGGLDNVFVDPSLQWLSHITSTIEIPLNVALIVIFLGLGVALTGVRDEQVRPFLVLAIMVSLVIWWGTQAFGMILSGMATDFNSGLLLVVIALACWPPARRLPARHDQQTRELNQPERAAQPV